MERTIKAISLHQPYASMIADGEKTIETRPWATTHRGELLICSTKQPKHGDLPLGKALCIVDVVDCRDMVVSDEEAACCRWEPLRKAWMLANIRRIEPFPVKGKQGFFRVTLPTHSETTLFNQKATECQNTEQKQ